MNGEVARRLGRAVGNDLLTKKAAAVYNKLFEKIASKLGKHAGLNSMEVEELVKGAKMTRWERALAYGGPGALAGAAGGSVVPVLGTTVGGILGGLGAGAYGYFSGDDEEVSPGVKKIQEAKKVREAA